MYLISCKQLPTVVLHYNVQMGHTCTLDSNINLILYYFRCLQLFVFYLIKTRFHFTVHCNYHINSDTNCGLN